MKLLFLGTGAPEGNPSPFCDCANCKYVRRHKKRNIRLQASVLINNELLIDFGPDITREFNRLGKTMSKLKWVLVTHCHFDHFFGGNFFHRLIGPRTKPIIPLVIYGPERIKTISKEWLFKPAEQKVKLKTIKPFEKVKFGKYTIKTFSITQSDNFAGLGMFFVISDGKKNIVYAVDTYAIPEENWKKLLGMYFDTVILDETFGYKNPPNKDHHNIPVFLKTIQSFKENGLIDGDTKLFTQHMSHHNPPHDKLVQIMAKHHVRVPYDGLEIVC